MSPTKDKRNYFGKEIRALQIFGVSLSGKESLAYKMYSILFLPATVFMYPLLDFYEYFKHDKSVIADIIIYQTGTFMAMCKTAVVLRNRIKFGKLLAKLEREPFIPNVDRGGQIEEELIKECVWFTRAETLTYWVFTIITVTVAMTYTVMKRVTSDDYHDWQMPYGPLTLFNATYSPGFEINWLYQNVSIIFLASVFTTIDMLLAAILAHVTYQFKIVQNLFRKVVETARKQMMEETKGYQNTSPNNLIENNPVDGSDIPWKYLQKSIIEAIQHHVAIVDIAKEIDEVFSELLLLVFLGTLAMLCFTIYAATAANSLQSGGKHIAEGVITCTQVATVCFWGEQVLQESQQVGRAAYESNFVGTDVRFQKMLALVIRRSQNPTRITAGKFADICISTFGWILRTSYSSFMVLRKANM